MVSDIRVTYRRRHSYNTVSNKYHIVKTPGARLVVQYNKKIASPVKCGCCKKPLAGIPRISGRDMRRLCVPQRSVTRAYGGNLCHKCVRDRILRAFLIEEQKIVKKVASVKAMQKKEEKKSTKKSAKKTTKKTGKK
ncbi:60S ribosomal protein L34 [Blastocystis sp. subtype 4]|uniref:60S ribosomal protein L34 n=1 Tax=Blastocystis sp. subtype 4 TaxID=944170 RepID=UPI000711C3F1|nr:60S ribosomal protein L34 [Blastocystis sp. subtype 4]KNB46012.1 60S ribosomal protein L34 [Blastocystis sp. subtype 4]|eukprot:XP_014529455.1 60S ribosomal protein L34 [Blastocystis sp. subtype 4]